MKFGLFGSAQAPRGPAGAAAKGFWDYVETCVEAESLGYHSTFLVEHHFSGAGQVSASLNLQTWVAARTTRMRLGTAVIVLPWHNPILLAEQAATIDLMSGGRLDFGCGRGYRHSEFDGFCMSYDEAESRFEESLELIKLAWTSDERFSYEGKHWQVHDIIVEPQPAQRPHPPIWIAAGSEGSIRKVARRGANLILDQFASPAQLAERIAIYKTELAAAGRPVDPMQVAVARNFYVASGETDLEAALQRTRKVHERNIRLSRGPDERNRSHILNYADTPGATEEHALFGSAEKIARQVAELRAVGVRYVLLNGNLDAAQSVRRFASEVMPQFVEPQGVERVTAGASA